MKSELNEIDVKDLDLNHDYFHFTSKENLESIYNLGLVPKKGENAKGIEKTEKIFFTIGSDYFLILMDVWLKWMIAKSLIDLPGKKLDNVCYHFFAWIVKFSFIPNFIVNTIVKIEFKTRMKRSKVYKMFKELLVNSVLFKLDIENKVDFDFEDVDEVKNEKYSRELLKMVFPSNCDVEEVTMDFWNMHTFSNHTIDKDKLSLVYIEDKTDLESIVKYFISNSKLKLKHSCPYLYDYLKWDAK